MRYLRLFMILFVAIWCGWWILASWAMHRGVTAMIHAQQVQGWQIEADTRPAGFPFNIRKKLRNLTASNPMQQIELKADGGYLQARTYWPGYVDVVLPHTPMVMQTPVGDVSILAQEAVARLRLRPGTALSLNRVTLNSDEIALRGGDAPFVSAQGLSLSARQNNETPMQYDLQIEADQLRPGTVPRQFLSLPTTWPETFETFVAKADITFDSALDRTALGEVPPLIQTIRLKTLAMRWGAFDITGSGTLTVAPDGTPDGAIDLKITDWNTLLNLAQLTGVVTEDGLLQTQLFLQLMANRSGKPEDIDVSLVFENGQMILSDIVLGPAPKLLLR